MVIFDANLEMKSASSIAEFPPPITTTSLSTKYLASQVAQYEIPRPLNSISPGIPIRFGEVPVAMMIFLGFLSFYFKENGLIVFTMLLQSIMYQEMTTVIGGEFTNPLLKWYWFLSALVVINGPKIMPHQTTVCQAITYGMTILSFLTTTIGFQFQKSKTTNFRRHLCCAFGITFTIL